MNHTPTELKKTRVDLVNQLNQANSKIQEYDTIAKKLLGAIQIVDHLIEKQTKPSKKDNGKSGNKQ